MKKATQKSAPVNLGTKRTCPQCQTKFYDFGKEVIICPKCETDLATVKAPSAKEAKKKREIPEQALMETEDVTVGSESEIESVDDIDDDEDAVDDIEVDGDTSEDF